MTYATKNITAEQYNEIQANGLDKSKYFTSSELWGYGVYYPQARVMDNGTYIISYYVGDSCD